MTGYVIADKPEMKVREYELYNAYYCGVCQSIARRFGQIPRFLLSYDSAFLAVLLSSLTPQPEQVVRRHCLVHPVKKKHICTEDPAVDYAADVLMILAYGKIDDDIRDEGKLSARAMRLRMKGVYQRLQQQYPALCRCTEEQLRLLSELEEARSPSLDGTGAAFGRIMEEAFSAYPEVENRGDQAILRQMGSALGKWMYLLDAWDDIEENAKDGNYNPLFYRYEFRKQEENPAQFRERIRERVETLLFLYLGELSKAYDLLSLRKNHGIIDNIIYFGLHRKTEEVLKKGNTESDERSL